MAQVSRLAAILNGYVEGVDISASDLITNSVWVGGTGSSPSVQVTTTLLNSFLTGLTAGSGISITGSAPTLTVAVDSTVIRTSGANAFAADQSMGSHKLTSLAAGTVSADAVNYGQVLLASGANAATGALDMGSNLIHNVTDPASAQDAATKHYVDALVNGLSWKNYARLATAAALPANTYANGSSGVGATLTATANGALSVDGTAVAVNDRILVKDEATGANNGIYIVTQAGDASHPYILTRAVDSDTASELVAAAVWVDEGSTNISTGWVQTVAAPITIGTTALSYSKFSGTAAAYTFRNGLSLTGSTVDVAPGDNSLTATSGSLVVKEDPAGAITTGASGIKVAVDGSTIDISANAIEVKAGGITNTQVSASAAIAYSKLSLTNSIVNADINSAAAIAYSKLSLTGSIVNADISASAAIAYSKLNLSNSIVAGDLTANSVTSAKIATSAVDGTTISGGGGSALTVNYSPAVEQVFVSGATLSANTSYLVRLAVNGETAGRVYLADSTTASNGDFWAIGIASGGAGGVSIGGNVTVMMLGSWTLGSSDTAFGATDVGKPVWLGASGAFTVTAPSSAGTADYKVGIVRTTGSILMTAAQLTGIN